MSELSRSDDAETAKFATLAARHLDILGQELAATSFMSVPRATAADAALSTRQNGLRSRRLKRGLKILRRESKDVVESWPGRGRR